MSPRLLVLGACLFSLSSGCSRGPAEGAGPRGGGPDPAARPVPVLAVAASQRDVPIYREGLGSVSAYKTVVVRPQVDGRLQEVYFKEGQAVRRGELLAQVDPRPFQAQLQQAEGALARDSAALQAGRRNLERYVALRNDRLLAPQQVDDQQALVGQQEGSVRVDQAQVQNARLLLEYARVTAPIDGITGIRQVDPGNLVRQGDATGIVTITQIDPIAVLFTLPQDDLPKVARAMNEHAAALGRDGGVSGDAKAAPEGLPVEAWSREGQELLGTGQLLVIDNQINPSTATIRMKAVFANPRRALWPNLFVKARLRLTVRRGALVVPLSAVQRGPRGTFVYVVTPEQTAALRPVELEQSTGELALLRAGVRPGELVVTDGQSQLRPGSKVAPGAAPAGRPDAGGGRGPGAAPSGRGEGGAGAHPAGLSGARVPGGAPGGRP